MTDHILAADLFAALTELRRTIDNAKEMGLKVTFVGGFSNISQNSVYISRDYSPTEETEE